MKGPMFRKLPVNIHAFRTTARKVIQTLEGRMVANPGDWIITGVEGERYPCKDSVFRVTYAPISHTARKEWDAKMLQEELR